MEWKTVVRLQILLLSCLLFLALIPHDRAHADAFPTSKFVDPAELERPIEPNDPLVLFKQMWAMGARGTVLELRYGYDEYDGYYFYVHDWGQLQIHTSADAVFLRDRDVLSQIQALHQNGVEFIVHSRIPNGGFVVGPQYSLYNRIVPLVPQLNGRPFIGINAWTHQYLLNHELIHHDDHRSALSSKVLHEVTAAFSDSLSLEERDLIYYFILEARSFLAEIATLHRVHRLIEWEGLDPHQTEHTPVRPLPGKAFRERRVRDLYRDFNSVYASPLEALAPAVMVRAQALFAEYIPDYLDHFDSHHRLRMSNMSCFNLLSGR